MSRRLGRLGAALLSSAVLITAVPAPAVAGPSGAAPPGHSNRPAQKKKDRLGAHDRDLLAQAVRAKKTTVTAMFAVTPGDLAATRKAVEAAGGRVVSQNAKVGYLRASVPTGKVDALAENAAVLAVDLDEKLKLDDPAAEKTSGAATAAASAPGPGTPALNAYLPVGETGAASFAAAHPEWDGRGVTIGVLDSGVDLDHPALATTTTGERKIVDWVTATDPLTEGDGTWLQMSASVTATPTFRTGGTTYTAPESGSYRFATFSEGVTRGDTEVNGDVNRDGDPYDSWAVLYRASDNAVWVDADDDGLFTDEPLLRPYREQQQVGHFGTDDPATDVRETMPFVVEFREDVDLSPLGQTGKVADFVSIGLPAGAHGTHVAGIAAGRGLFGGAMNGAAPGAKIVSARACTWAGGCTAVALTEGMIDLVANRGVDVVNMSIGGLPALNDGASARALLYDALIEVFGVQIFISSGNAGPGVNTVADPSVASTVVSVGATISRETWAADYGSDVATPMSLFGFSSRGPREDGGFKPDLVAPGAAVSSIPTWLAGEAVPGVGYALPAGYGMFNGTSMASPQAAGAAALLLSAAAATGAAAGPAQLRTALADGARLLPGTAAHEQGNGLIDVAASWALLARGGLARSTYAIDAPVCTPLSAYLPTPGRGAGLYDRCGGTGDKIQEVRVTRTSGPAGALKHKISWVGGDGTYAADADTIRLPLNVPVTVRVHVKPRGNGAHSAIMVIDDVASPGRDALMLATTITSATVAGPAYRTVHSGTVTRVQAESYFVTVPENAKTLQVRLDGVADGSRVRLVGQHPYGVPVEDGCFTDVPVQGCDALVKAYRDPMPGVWEITVEAARTSPLEANPFRLTVDVFGVTAKEPAVLGTLDLHKPADVQWEMTNRFAPVDLAESTSPLASRQALHPTIADGDQQYFGVIVPIGATRFEVAIGAPSDTAADLDLLVAVSGVVIGMSADADSEESVVIENPPPGLYQVIVDGYAVPSGTTEYSYSDEVRTPSLGSVKTTYAAPQAIANGGTATVTAQVTAATVAPEGRQLAGVLELRNTAGAIVGEGLVTIGGVNGPQVVVKQVFGPMMALTARNGVVAGSTQHGVSVPTRWTATGGMQPYFGYEGHIFSLNNRGDGVGQSEHIETPTLPGIFRADGTVTELPLPDWAPDALYGRAFAINDAGTVVGNITRFVHDDTGYHWFNEPYRWTPTGGYTRLAHLTDDPSLTEPLAINADGVVVGQSTKDGVLVAVWWDASGAVHEIGMVDGEGDSVLLSVNDNGVAVGESGSRAAIWTADGGIRRLPDFGLQSKAVAVNASGWVIGTADVAPYEPHVVAWDPQGRLYDLSAALGWDRFYAEDAVGVTDAGEFIVYGQPLDGSDGTNAVLTFA